MPRLRAPRLIVARSGAMSWPSTRRVAAYGRPCRRRAAPCRAPAGPYSRTGLAVSQHCIATRPAAKPLLPCHDTINCIVTRPQPNCPLVMIQRLYRDTTTQRPAPRLCHDTILCIATQFTSQAPHERAADRVVPSLGRIMVAAVVVSQTLLRASPAMSWPPGCT